MKNLTGENQPCLPEPSGCRLFWKLSLVPSAPKRPQCATSLLFPALSCISNILRKHFNILRCSNRSKNVFKQLSFVAYRSSSKLRDLLVKAASSAVDKIVPLVHTLPTVLQVILFILRVKHASSLHTLLVTLKTWSTRLNITVVTYNI